MSAEWGIWILVWFFLLYILIFWKSWLMNQLGPSEQPWAALKLGYSWPRCYDARLDTLQCTPNKASGECRKYREMEHGSRLTKERNPWLKDSWAGKDGLSLGEPGIPEDQIPRASQFLVYLHPTPVVSACEFPQVPLSHHPLWHSSP